MSLALPTFTTDRLIIRPFVMEDLDDLHRIMDLEAEMEPGSREERAEWLEWSIRNYTALARLWQPPMGDRAVVRKADGGPQSGELIGVAGYNPAMGPFATLPGFPKPARPELERANTFELGMFWALGNAYRGQGYATEAARALIDYAFQHLNVARVVAVTEYANIASQRVMERVGMRLERNPYPEPEWFQVVGYVER